MAVILSKGIVVPSRGSSVKTVTITTDGSGLEGMARVFINGTTYSSATVIEFTGSMDIECEVNYDNDLDFGKNQILVDGVVVATLVKYTLTVNDNCSILLKNIKSSYGSYGRIEITTGVA